MFHEPLILQVARLAVSNIRAEHIGLDECMNLGVSKVIIEKKSTVKHTSCTEAWINWRTSSASQTLIMLSESSFRSNSLPSFRTLNFLSTGSELM